MMEPAIFKVVSGDGEVHAENITQKSAYAMAEFLLTNRTVDSRDNTGALTRNLTNVRVELMTPPVSTAAPVTAPHIVTPLPDIEPGKERDALREAIETRLDAAVRLDAASQAVERASAFVAARQSELDAMTAAYLGAIEASGANLAEALKAGGAAFDASRPIDRSAVMDAEEQRDMARAALDRLTAEQRAAAQAHTAAETGVRLAMMAVKRADVEGMVRRLQDVKTEYMALATAIEGARFSDVPSTQAGLEAMRFELPHAGHIDAAAKVWHRYSAALRDDPDALREDFA